MQKHLEYHMLLHSQPDAFACPDCGKNFSNPSSLRIHRLLDHESPDQETPVERRRGRLPLPLTLTLTLTPTPNP